MNRCSVFMQYDRFTSSVHRSKTWFKIFNQLRRVYRKQLSYFMTVDNPTPGHAPRAIIWLQAINHNFAGLPIATARISALGVQQIHLLLQCMKQLVKCAHADSISVSGLFWSPRVFSAYYTLFQKSRRFLTLINAFLRLQRKRHGTGKNTWQTIEIIRLNNCEDVSLIK